ncbi:MAG: glycosyl transferase family 28 [Fibrobacter sp.]|nr:glycosyl transferase family 28 [Fibrobacter sp.]
MKVLVAPLDWGLGHATRCVPVIKEFLRQGAQVELAVTDSYAPLYREIFPELKKHTAPSYGIVYPKHGFNMGLWLLKNSAHLNKVIEYEHHYAEEMVRRHDFDILFSDNRFGFYSDKAFSIYMTHQCRIAFPTIFSKFEGIGIHWHKKKMGHFDQVWIPDLREAPGYAGAMSHVKNFAVPVRYAGPLSRFAELENLSEIVTAGPKDLGVVAVISGVEPARSTFERKLRELLTQVPGNHVMILGKPGAERKSWTEGNVQFFSHLETTEFARAVSRARWIVSRGGYSTVMDMATLGASCIFVPTPGQYEQVVLSRNLSRAGYAVNIPAGNLSLETLQAAMKSHVALPKPPTQNLLTPLVQEALKQV